LIFIIPSPSRSMSIKVSFPDGSERVFEDSISVKEIAEGISHSLMKKSVVAIVNDKVVDLDTKLTANCTLKIITSDTKDTKDKQILLDTMRHSCAHLFAQAMRELYGDKVHFGFGPEVENGFYYDFELTDGTKITTEDFSKIEKKMHELAERDFEVIRKEWESKELFLFFKKQNELYKQEQILKLNNINNIEIDGRVQSMSGNNGTTKPSFNNGVTILNAIYYGDDKCARQEVVNRFGVLWIKELKQNFSNIILSTYTQDKFTDLCRGPHVPSTGFLKYFKLMKVAGAYWRGDSKNVMLQRVYGTCWATQKELDDYLKMLEEAEKRDHRKLGQQLDLFHMQEEAPGCCFWHPRGWTLYTIIQNYMRKKLQAHGYIEVKTPQIVSKTLWEKSGHWAKYREHMFITRIDEEDMDFAIKPMNCPCHVEIFKNKIRSYKDLPIRMAEFGKCHRYEPSGSLHGLMRVRGFVQDDAHIFCSEDQIASECVAFYQLLKEVYDDFGFTDIKVKFSDRPEMRVGSDALWDKAEKALREPMEQMGIDMELNKGEGAFYGPKLEFTLRDAIGREWQCGTFQVDFNLGQRLGAEYTDADGSKKAPVMLHRAVLGSFERFIAILIENHAGALPLWLAPVQAMVIGVSNDFDKQVEEITAKLQSAGIRCECDLSKETVSYKVRHHSEMKIPYIITIGKKELEDGTLSVRKFGEMKNVSFDINKFVKTVEENVKNKQ